MQKRGNQIDAPTLAITPTAPTTPTLSYIPIAPLSLRLCLFFFFTTLLLHHYYSKHSFIHTQTPSPSLSHSLRILLQASNRCIQHPFPVIIRSSIMVRQIHCRPFRWMHRGIVSFFRWGLVRVSWRLQSPILILFCRPIRREEMTIGCIVGPLGGCIKV